MNVKNPNRTTVQFKVWQWVLLSALLLLGFGLQMGLYVGLFVLLFGK